MTGSVLKDMFGRVAAVPFVAGDGALAAGPINVLGD